MLDSNNNSYPFEKILDRRGIKMLLIIGNFYKIRNPYFYHHPWCAILKNELSLILLF
jgi:hypothetical protein